MAKADNAARIPKVALKAVVGLANAKLKLVQVAPSAFEACLAMAFLSPPESLLRVVGSKVRYRTTIFVPTARLCFKAMALASFSVLA